TRGPLHPYGAQAGTIVAPSRLFARLSASCPQSLKAKGAVHGPIEADHPEPPPIIPDPPAHLSPRSQALWCELVPRRAKSPERLTLLQAALEALDRVDLAREAITKEGMITTTETTGAVHVHPLCKLEREAKAQFLTGWRDLGFAKDFRLDGMMA